MPLYDFQCQWCEHADAESFRMGECPSGSRKCPKCKRKKYIRIFGTPYTKTSKTLKTFGQQAEKNQKEIGREGMEFIVRQDKRRRWEAARDASEEVSRNTGGKPVVLPKLYDDVKEDSGLKRHVKKITGDENGVRPS